MTVCIAAVCGNTHPEGPFIITASDRMISIGDIEYEPAQTKTVNLATQTVALCAGDMQLHAAVIPKVQASIKADLADNPHNINVSRIAELYAEEFAYYRRAMAEREILVPRGLNFDRFLSRQSTMAHYQVEEIDARLASYHIPSSAIVAGLDPSGGHLYKIENPGIALCYDTPFFACIGSGEALAATQFMVKGFEKNWGVAPTLWLAFEAKARAEAAGGVGQQTDVVIIARGGRVYQLNDEEKEILHSLYESTVEREAIIAKEASEKIQEYLKSRATPKSADMQQTASPDEAKQQNEAEAPKRKQSRPKRK